MGECRTQDLLDFLYTMQNHQLAQKLKLISKRKFNVISSNRKYVPVWSDIEFNLVDIWWVKVESRQGKGIINAMPWNVALHHNAHSAI